MGIRNQAKGWSKSSKPSLVQTTNNDSSGNRMVMQMEYRADKQTLLARQPKTKNLARMGIHRPDGYHFFPEEAVYLVEQGQAMVVCNGQSLSLTQLYSMLGSRGISLLKYGVYQHMKQRSYVVRRPIDPNQPFPAAQNSSMSRSRGALGPPPLPRMRVMSYHFPTELLDLLPNVASDGKSVQIPRTVPHLLNDQSLLGDDLNPSEVLAEEKCKVAESHSAYSIGQWDNAPWVDLRPRYWPLFKRLRECSSWKVYEMERERLLRTAREGLRIRKEKKYRHDYDIYSETQKTAEPIYRLLVMDDRYNTRLPSTTDLGVVARESDVPLLIATGSATSVRFAQFSAESNQALSICTP